MFKSQHALEKWKVKIKVCYDKIQGVIKPVVLILILYIMFFPIQSL